MENQTLQEYKENQTKQDKVLNHLEWLYPSLKIGLMGSDKFGIHFKGLMFSSDFDKINEIGFDVVCVQADDNNNIIATIKDHRKDRPNI